MSLNDVLDTLLRLRGEILENRKVNRKALASEVRALSDEIQELEKTLSEKKKQQVALCERMNPDNRELEAVENLIQETEVTRFKLEDLNAVKWTHSENLSKKLGYNVCAYITDTGLTCVKFDESVSHKDCIVSLRENRFEVYFYRASVYLAKKEGEVG